METITVDSLQQKINSIADLIQLQSKQFDERLDKSKKEYEERLDKSNKEYNERLEKERKEYLHRLKKLEGNWTTFTESLIKPGIIELFLGYGINLHNMYTNVIFYTENNEPFYEIDLLLTNQQYIVLVEIKTKLNSHDVQEHLQRIEKVQKHPHKDFNWKNKTIIGCVAGITADDSAIKFAIKSGLFVLVQKGHLVEVVNDNPFKFKTWGISQVNE